MSLVLVGDSADQPKKASINYGDYEKLIGKIAREVFSQNLSTLESLYEIYLNTPYEMHGSPYLEIMAAMEKRHDFLCKEIRLTLESK
jgi:hypothetical protein